METLQVELGARSYDIVIGEGLFAQAAERIAALESGKRLAIVTDENVAALHLPELERQLASGGFETVSLVLPAGERTKSWPHFSKTVDWLLEQKVERGDAVIALLHSNA